MLAFICLIVALLFLLHKYISREYGYFEAKGIPYSKPTFFVGSRKEVLSRNKSPLTVMRDFYNEFPNDKVSGLFDLDSPVYLIRDPHLIKQLAIKEFDNFADHKFFFDADSSSVCGRSLFNLQGQHWRDMRATLSPAFTSRKMRLMFELMNVVGQQVVNAISDQIQNTGDNVFQFEDLSRRYAVDVIASCVLGIEVNSFKNPKNEIYEFAVKMSSSFNSSMTTFKLFANLFVPKLMKLFKVSLFSQAAMEPFHDFIRKIMKIRERNNIVRPDLINLLLQAKKGKLSHESENDSDGVVDGFATVEESHVGKATVIRKWEDDDLIAQTFIFFFAGTDSISTGMSMIAYELMMNPDFQVKLQKEIDEISNEPLNYNRIQSMNYMDQVVCETLRKWPPALIERSCNRDFELEYDGKKILIEKGRNFYVPLAGIHHDEKYFPNSDEFDPERFSYENRKKIDPATYLPFGIGPRGCIGSRFALMKLKTIAYYLLLNFNFEPSEKTQIPMKFKPHNISLIPEKGVWIKLTPRNKSSG